MDRTRHFTILGCKLGSRSIFLEWTDHVILLALIIYLFCPRRAGDDVEGMNEGKSKREQTALQIAIPR